MRPRRDLAALVALCALAAVPACSSARDAGFEQTGGAAPLVDAGSEAEPSDAAVETASDAPLDASDAGDAAPPPCTVNVPQDQPTIAAAVAAVADGGVVCLADGTYAELVQLTDATKSLTIRAAGVAAEMDGQLQTQGVPGAGQTLTIEGIAFGCAPQNLRVRRPAGRIVVRRNVFHHDCGVALDLATGPGDAGFELLFERNVLRDAGVLAVLNDPGGGQAASLVFKNNLVRGGATFTLTTDTKWAAYRFVANTFALAPGTTALNVDLGADEGAGSELRDNLVTAAVTRLLPAWSSPLAPPGAAISCPTCSALAVDHNLYWVATPLVGNAPSGPGDRTADPLLAGDDDLHPLAFSPAVYAGVRTPGAAPDVDPSEDFDGTPRPQGAIDIGALQHR